MEIVTPKELEQAIDRLGETLAAQIARLVPQAAPQEYFTRPEAAQYLRISLRTLDTLAATGGIQRAKLADGPRAGVLFRRRDLDDFVESRIEMDRQAARRYLNDLDTR